MIEYDFEGYAKSQIDKALSYLEGFSKGYHQAKSEWIGLTDDDIKVLAIKHNGIFYDCDIDFAKAIETKLKEKNA